MVTRRGAGILCASLVAWGVGWLLGLPALHAVAAGGVSAVAVALFGAQLAGGGLALRRAPAPATVQVGDAIEVVVHLRHTGRVGLSGATLRDAGPRRSAPACSSTDGQAARQLPAAPTAGSTLQPGATQTSVSRVVAVRRGRLVWGPASVSASDPLGLAEVRREFAGRTEVLVHPRPRLLPHDLTGLSDLAASGGSDARSTGGQEEFHSLRGYVPGDDLRTVHWASSARRGTLLVREAAHTSPRRVTVLLDTRRAGHALFDGLVEVAAGIVEQASAQRLHTSLLTGDDRDGQGEADRAALLDRLAVLDTGGQDRLSAAVDRLSGAATPVIAVLAACKPSGGRHDEVDEVDEVDGVAATVEVLGPVAGLGARAHALVVGDGGAALVAALAATGWSGVALAPAPDRDGDRVDVRDPQDDPPPVVGPPR